jgi:hypothetical protein
MHGPMNVKLEKELLEITPTECIVRGNNEREIA